MFFGKKKEEPVLRVGATAAPSSSQKRDAEEDSKGEVVAIRGSGPVVAEEADAPVSSNGIITNLNQLPDYQAILTAGDSHSVFKLPKSLEFSIVALQLAPTRAAIYYDPSAPTNQVSHALQELRTALTIGKYSTDSGEIRCSGEVIRKLVEDYRKRNGTESLANSNSSKNKQLWEAWVEMSVKERATDLHIQPYKTYTQVYIRVDGELEPLPDEEKGHYTRGQAEAAASWGYTNGIQDGSNNATSWNTATNLSGMTKPRTVCGKQISQRFQTLVGQYGPKVICRNLNIDDNQPTLTYEQLGYSPDQKALFKEAARTTFGLVLFSGITGSGKTTSQKTFIETHPGNGSSAFYSIEDPVEYPLKGVHQIQNQSSTLDPAARMRKFNALVADLLRSDPDGVIIGEIRDQPSAAAAQQIFETGCLGIGTVHAHLISGIIPRLTDDEIGMSREVLTSPNALTLLVYQGLVPKLCPKCKINACDESEFGHAYFGSSGGAMSVEEQVEDLHYVLNTIEKRFELPKNHFNFRRAGGCTHCRGRGTNGLTVVAEMLIPDEKWLELIRHGHDHKAVEYYRSFSDGRFDTENMTGKTVFEHTLFKAYEGTVDPRRCEAFGSFSRFEVLKKAKE